MIGRLLFIMMLSLAGPVQAHDPAPAPSLQAAVEAELAKAPRGIRFGLLVTDPAGEVLVAVNPDQRFVPASNTKLFTTAAAYALLPALDQPDGDAGAQVFLVPGKRKSAPDLLLYGRGDARMSSAADCVSDCLAALADAVAARTRTVHDVTGDDTRYADQRWSLGMSWNNLGSADAAAASALSLDGNEVTVRVQPGAVGAPPIVTAPEYLVIDNQALTTAAGTAAPCGSNIRSIRAASGCTVACRRTGVSGASGWRWTIQRTLPPGRSPRCSRPAGSR